MPADPVRDLLLFLDASPTPYHAVAEARRRLDAAGYTPMDESSTWQLDAGDRRYVVRGDGGIAAFEVGTQPPSEAGFRIAGAHTDSPNLRIKPLPELTAEGYRQLAVEPYGAVLLHTWLDRDLSLAGRVTFREDDGLGTVLVDFERPLLRVPSLAIHLCREIGETGLKLNAQQHMLPVMGLADAPELLELLAGEVRRIEDRDVEAADIMGFDLMTYDTQGATISGASEEFVHSARIDNLVSCHAALSALLEATEALSDATRVVVLYDHEEVGSRSAHGAAGPFLAELLDRVVAATSGSEVPAVELFQAGARARSRSTLVSVDAAHAVHPNYADKHERGHKPVIGKGPVIKVNNNLAYASDGGTVGLLASLCRACDVAPQYFVSRSDLPCGSTIGPIAATRVGIRTVDVGSPMLAMHSCREMAGTADVVPMIRVLAAYLRGA